jgi:hypothetical protein
LDEIRISSVARSAGWIATEYNNQSNPSGFAGFSSEYSVPAVTILSGAQAVNCGQSVTFSVSATGTPTPSYQWQFNGANIAGATNATFTIAAACPGNAGIYSMVLSNAAGVFTTDVQLAVNPFQIATFAFQTNDAMITWTTTGGQTNVVQATSDLTLPFTNLSTNIVIPGASATTTNYLDAGAATNSVTRYYRIMIVQ